MGSLSARSTVKFVRQVVAAHRWVILALTITLLQCGPIVAQSMVPRNSQRVRVQPLRSLAEVVRGEQTIRTRNGITCLKVHIRPQDEIWLVSARQDAQCDLTAQKLIDGQWVAASMAELTQAHVEDQQKTSLVYVHGNRTNEVYARSRGLQFYENIFNDQLCSGPVRFVIFAWRSEREKVGPAIDFRIKLDRSVALGPTFAGFVDQFEDRRLILAGFSLGGQIVLSSLVQLECQAANDPEPKFGKYRVALVTPALKASDALNSVASLPSNPLVTETVVFINQRDIAIRAASLATRKTGRDPAVTLEQVAQQPADSSTNSVVIEDITLNVSRLHSISRYSARSARLQMVINRMANDVRGNAGLMSPECDQCRMSSVVEMAAPVEVLSSEPAVK